MGDIFLHVLFARRLRHASALHPVAAEALARRPSLVAYGAALPLLPALERSRVSFFKRIFGIGAGESQKWTRALEARGSTLSELAVALCAINPNKPNNPHTPKIPLGPLPRLALAIGVLSHDVLSKAVDPTLSHLDASLRPSYARGQARLWMQFAVPTRRELVAEWAAARAVQDTETMKRGYDALDRAFSRALKETPGKEVFTRWARGLAHAVSPLVEGSGMPDALGVSDHDVRETTFDGSAAFIEKTQEAATRLAFLVGRLASIHEGRVPSASEVRDALLDDHDALRGAPPSLEIEGMATRWRTRMVEMREDSLSRGRNPKAAYTEDGHPQMPPLPEDSGEAPAFRVPAHTQEITTAEISSSVGEATGSIGPSAPLKTQEISAVQIEEASSLPPLAPRVTQQISLADIAEEMVAADDGRVGTSNPFDAPSSTQQVSLEDIEAELSAAPTPQPPRPPAHTQQISAADIEAELASATPPAPPADDGAPDGAANRAAGGAPENGAAKPPPPPALTQQISAVDIEAELEAKADAAPSAGETTPERPAE